MLSKPKPYKIAILILIVLFYSLHPIEQVLGEDMYAASYKTYDTTYEDILKMYLRVMPAQCREQSRRRHDTYNEFMYDDLWSYYMDYMSTPEYERLNDAEKAAKKKELQEKTLNYMKNTIGYSIQDINNDGIDELIIGRDQSYIYELFTIDDGKVRELIKAGYRNTCNLLDDGTLYRFAHHGGGFAGYFMFQMNGTSKVKYIKGYYYDGQLGYDNNLGEDCWFNITDPNAYVNLTMDQHVPSSEALRWISECESRFAHIRFIPLSAYEKGMSGDGIAVLSVKGKTSGTQKVRIRAKPNSKSKILVQKRVGTYVKAIGVDGDYYKVTVGKKTGYVHKDFITLITDLPNE